MSAKRVTMSDIAAKTGFSKTAVSFAFNKPDRISPESRERILAVAKENGYIPDPMARNFSTGRYMNVGLLLPQKVQSSLSNPYTHGIIKGIAEVCQTHDYMFTVIPPIRSSINESVRNATVDGIITMGLYVSDDIDEILEQRQIPVVAIDGADSSETISVCIDEVEAARIQMMAVLDRGHRRIAVFSLQDDAYASNTPAEARSIVKKRKLGYSEALQSVGMSFSDVQCINLETTFESGQSNMAKLLEKDMAERPTCIVCMSDISALGALAAIREAGLSSPEDISVIGFDGLEDLKIYGRRLTTIRQSAYEKGLKSAEILFSLIGGSKLNERIVRVPFELLEGETLGDAKC